MKFIAIPFLIVLVLAQSMSFWVIKGAFMLNQKWIAKNTCENRFRPELKCGGQCVLMKKIRQQGKEEQKEPTQLKLEVTAVLISSRTFFAIVPDTVPEELIKYILPYNTGAPVDRSFAFFHPPKFG